MPRSTRTRPHGETRAAGEQSGSPGTDDAILLPAPSASTAKLSQTARDYVTEVRSRLEEAHWSGAAGLETTLRFSGAVDNLVRFIVDSGTERFTRRYARAHQRCAIIAQGGYGRREMSPYSDVDLLVLYPGRMTPYVETINELLIQTLFDAGLQVGWAVRTARECVALAQDLTIKTNLLDGRFLCGSTEVGAEFTEAVQDVLAGRDVPRFVEQKLAESRDRHQRMGASVFMLEPDVKEGVGGQRDLHTLLWTARVLKGAVAMEDLVEAGVLVREEVEGVYAAREFICRVRNSIHFLKRHKIDKLGFELQEEIASRFEYSGSDGHKAVDLFMRDYYSHAAIVARTVDDAIDRMTATAEPKGLVARLTQRTLGRRVGIVGGQAVADERLFRRDPVNLIRVFVDAQRHEASLSASSREAVRACIDLLTPAVAESRAAVEAFLAVLRGPGGVYRSLAEMNRLGVLGKLIPEFGRLFCMVQHDLYHVYTVDEHSLMGVHELEVLRGGELAHASPLLTQVMGDHARPELVYLGMMMHDLGKGYGGDHDERGAEMVGAIAGRLGLSDRDKEALEFMVRNHLLMSSLAQNRDIEDSLLLAHFAGVVGSRENLDNLYLLTFADMRSVGPKMWNGWKDHLLAELYLRTLDVFEKGAVTGADLERRIEGVKAAVRERAAALVEKERLGAFLDGMPSSYFISHNTGDIIAHWRLSESLGSALFRAGVEHFNARGYSELTLCARDREGLFAGVTGLLTACGLNVIGARIATSTVGLAIDTFRVDHQTSLADATAAEVWDKVRRLGEKAITSEMDVAATVAEALGRRPAPPAVERARRRAMTRVEIDNEVSREQTVIDVYAADRPGLLFTLANAILRLGLRVQLAKITTYGHQVLDVFYVTDADDGKVLDPALLERVRVGLLEQIAALDDPPGDSRAAVG